MTPTQNEAVRLDGFAHIGIRVSSLERSCDFYRLLGFELVAGPMGPEPVAILKHPSGMELNLVLNALEDQRAAHRPNVLMDVPEKHPGFTHIALACPELDHAIEALRAVGVRISAGPVQFPHGGRAYFLRDPDANVIELHQPPSLAG